MKKALTLLTLISLTAFCAAGQTMQLFGQSKTIMLNQQGGFTEWHGIISKEVIRGLQIPGTFFSTDVLQVLVSHERTDVNQFNITIVYTYDGHKITDTRRVQSIARYMTMVAFPVPGLDVDVDISVEAVRAEILETATFRYANAAR